jgi:hypothetical protein
MYVEDLTYRKIKVTSPPHVAVRIYVQYTRLVVADVEFIVVPE